jgi:hypothetical protein
MKDIKSKIKRKIKIKWQRILKETIQVRFFLNDDHRVLFCEELIWIDFLNAVWIWNFEKHVESQSFYS